MDIIENLKAQSAINSITNPAAPVVIVPLPASERRSGFLDIDQQNSLEEQNTMEHLEALAKVEVKPAVPTKRSGEFPIKVTGDPYAGFAKGPREK